MTDTDGLAQSVGAAYDGFLAPSFELEKFATWPWTVASQGINGAPSKASRVSKGAGAILGIIGGMGPAATADFYSKLIRLTPAKSDQEHIPVLIYSDPQIPDRNAYVQGLGPSPLPDLLHAVRFLERSGAGCIAIACNSAHAWHGEMQSRTVVPILHIADAVCQMLSRDPLRPKVVGVLCTRVALGADVYRSRLCSHGYECLMPTEAELEDLVMKGIYDVKEGNVALGTRLLERAADSMKSRGAEKILLGCTEIPVALQSRLESRDSAYLDATTALAEACVAWWQSIKTARAIPAVSKG